MHTIEIDGRSYPVDQQTAFRAVARIKKMKPGLQALLRAVARNDKLVLAIEPCGGQARTTGNKVIIAPPIELGLNIPHQRQVCDLRDDDGQLRCTACRIHEDTLVKLYHEAGHHISESFAKVPETEMRYLIEAAVRTLGQNGDSVWAQRIAERINSLPYSQKSDYFTLSRHMSNYLPLLINALEDVRVMRDMFKVRPGVAPMWEAWSYNMMTKGREMEGGTASWKDAPLNSQAAVAVFTTASGFEFGDIFHPDVHKAMADPTIRGLLQSVRTADSVRSTYSLAVPLLERMRELGFFVDEARDPEDSIPEQPEQPEPPADTQPEQPQEQPQDDDNSPSDDGQGTDGDDDEQPAQDGTDEQDSDTQEDGDGTQEADAGGDGDDETSPDGRAEDSGNESEGDDEGGSQPGDSDQAGDGESSEGQSGEGSKQDGTGEAGSGADGNPESGGGDGGDTEGSDGSSGQAGSGPASAGGPSSDAPAEDDGRVGSAGASGSEVDERGSEGSDHGAAQQAEGTDGDAGDDAGTSPDVQPERGTEGQGGGGRPEDRGDEPSDDQGGAGGQGRPEDGEGEGEGRDARQGGEQEAATDDRGPTPDDRAAGQDGGATPEPGDAGEPADSETQSEAKPEGGSGAGSEPEAGGDGEDQQDGASGGDSVPNVPVSDAGDHGEGAGGGDGDPGDDGEDEGSAGPGGGEPDQAEQDDAGDDVAEGAGDQEDDAAGVEAGAESDYESTGDIDGPPVPFGERGDADTVQSDLRQFMGHDAETGELTHKNMAGRGTDSDEDMFTELAEMIDKAIQQGDFFDAPSEDVTGVKVHRREDVMPRRGPWSHLGDVRVSNPYVQEQLREMGAIIDDKPQESLLSRALLRTRVTFDNNKRKAQERNHKSGRVNAKVLARRAPLADPRLFTKTRRPGAKSYLVVIGIDISGSQSNGNLKLTKLAAQAQAELCARVGVPFEVWAHTGSHDRGSGYRGMQLDMVCVKEVNEPWDTNRRERLANLGCFGANLDGHTMEFYRKILDRSQATDRILMYYTDGAMPAANFGEELEVLQRELKLMDRRGYTVMGVGVETDSPTEHGLDTCQIDSMDDLAKVVQFLEKKLECK